MELLGCLWFMTKVTALMPSKRRKKQEMLYLCVQYCLLEKVQEATFIIQQAPDPKLLSEL